MKKLLAIVFLITLCRSLGFAQPYGNEWIDYNKTYYKFKIAQDGLCRINYATLIATGIPAAQLKGTDFKLICNGEEIPIYVTTANQFTASDFIEFYGKKNDGSVDTRLYKNPLEQPNPFVSMFSDTATYYLSLSPFTINKRIIDEVNDLSFVPEKEKYCYYSLYNMNTQYMGKAYPISVYFSNPPLYNSDFGLGDGYIKTFNASTSMNFLMQHNNLYLDENVPVFNTILFMHDEGTSKELLAFTTYDTLLTLSGRGASIVQFPLSNYVYRDNANMNIHPASVGAKASVGYYLQEYPKKFIFENNSRYSFSIKKPDDVYFEIKNFDNKSTVPLLYDLDNHVRYTGITDSVLKFHLNTTIYPKNHLYLTSQAATDIMTISSMQSVNFSLPLQGNYLIISNRKLKNSIAGIDFIDQYKQYRNSQAGGANNAQIYYYEDLMEQFGYNIAQHPLGIRNFINYAIDKFTVKPELVFIIGKGFPFTYSNKNATIYNRSLVPTYGEPASDNLLTARSAILNAPQLGIGRLDAITGDDIKIYLDKVKEYEQTLNDTLNVAETPYNKSWMKNVLHLAGGNNNFEQQLFRSYLENYASLIQAPYYGATVSSLYKNSTDPIQIAQNIFIDSLINTGVSLITFFGHSATSTLDFNLTPEDFTNRGRYHFMLTNGCFVGNIFADAGHSTLYSDRFVLTPNKAAIGFLAPMTYGVSSNLNAYSTEFYHRISNSMYNDKIGNILKSTSSQLINSGGLLEPSVAEQMIYHGDPGLRINTHYRPDYYIDQSSITFEPNVINTSADSFLLKVIVHNLGKAISADYTVNVDRILANGEVRHTSVRVPAALNIDTVYIWIQGDRLFGSGINTFKIKVDYNNEIAEYSELNNEVTITKTILADDIIPIFPYEFCIVNSPNPELVFSTANPFATPKTYIFQIDTTENFNSPLLQTVRLTQPGATIKWTPSISYIQNKVYYWRGAIDTTIGNPANWHNSSFLYNTSLNTGWNQSHYFQYKKDAFNTLLLDNDRIFKYPNTTRQISVHNMLYDDQSVEAYWDGYLIARNAWSRKGFIFFVYDAYTGKNWQTYQIGNTCRGPYQDITCNRYPTNVIEFITSSTESQADGKAERQRVIDFLNSIPCNAYVLGYSFFNAGYSQWDADSTSPLDQTLFTAFERIGVNTIRNQRENEPFVFFIHNCDPGFNKIQISRAPTANNPAAIIDTSFTFSGTWNKGTMQSTIIGPAKNWKTFQMDWHALENPYYDYSNVSIRGFDTSGTSTIYMDNLLKGIPIDISSIDAKKTPFIQLTWNTQDDSFGTAPQMDFWRVTYDKVPEAVVNPTIHFSKTRDTIVSGETLSLAVAVENVTPINMDSLLVRFTIRDASGNIIVVDQRYAPLPGKQYQIINFNYDFAGFNFTGLNTITVEVNPDNDQPEQFHFNNFAEFTVYVLRDRINPILDVTFDGRHITDGEYVSSTPEILLRLKDENKYLALNDTNEFLLYLYYPNAPTTPVLVDLQQSDITFIPADPSNLSRNNEARLIYKPTLQDGTYELRAQGIDRSRNDAGKYEYRIKFKVDSKPTITHVLNYPNPFSTSTQFVFTITGQQVPDKLMIQIFSASGKVVREISKEELGNLHIGTNVTDFKWDGTDMYGDRLANGVYFYRVYTKNTDGTNTEIKETGIDKFFKHGYGKLYIMR